MNDQQLLAETISSPHTNAICPTLLSSPGYRLADRRFSCFLFFIAHLAPLEGRMMAALHLVHISVRCVAYIGTGYTVIALKHAVSVFIIRLGTPHSSPTLTDLLF